MHAYTIAAALSAFSLQATAQSGAMEAVAELIATNSATSAGYNIRGSIYLSQLANEQTLSVRVVASGLEPYSIHGIHFNTWGDISDAAEGTSCGDIFAPFAVRHGCPAPAEWVDRLTGRFQAGALGNVIADAVGTVDFTFDRGVAGVSLAASDRANVIGRSVVLRQRIDDCSSQPDGNAGLRYAQGVIGWRVGTTIPSALSLPSTNRPSSSRSAIITLLAFPSSTGASPAPRGFIFLDQATITAPLRMRVTLSGLTPNTTTALRIHEFGDRLSGSLGPLFAPFDALLCAPSTTLPMPMVVDAFGAVALTMTVDPAAMNLFEESTSYVVGRLTALYAGEESVACGAASMVAPVVAAGVIGLRNPITATRV